MTLFYLLLMFCSLKLSVILCASDCENFKFCGDCIKYTLDKCVWCSAENHIGSRCRSKNNNTKWCAIDVYEPQKEVTFVKNKDWNTKQGGKSVQFKPQHVKVKASPGVSVNIKMSYKPAKDMPLDVYYLMDNSYTMNQYKEILRKQAVLVYEALTNLTNNVLFGIGSFIEKPALPFANTHFANSYCFKNHLSLTNDIKEFQFGLDNKTGGGNYDDQEAVLDGLMQAMVCEEQIRWRSDSRRIIIVFTDGSYHSAGDGKAVGAFKRHDMKCHIEGNMDTVFDYPSISQINQVIKDGSYAVIFAVTGRHKTHYKILSENLVGANYVLLTSNIDIAKTIKNEYLKIVEDVNIIYETSPYIDISTKKNCTNECKGLHYQPLEIEATIKVVSCPNPPKEKEFIKIGPISLNEALLVEVDFDCNCDCEKDNSKVNSDKCHHDGTYQCGICKCNPNRYGVDCRCTGDSLDNDMEKCKKNVNETVYCTGRGDCRCGKCEQCSKSSGPFCEFDDESCPRLAGVICSGNGICTMGKCVCLPKWSGEDCSCSTNEQFCTAPHSKKPCSGNGICKCGKCICDRTENPEDQCKGRFCDDCKQFSKNRCDELKDYAYCRFLNKTTCKDTLSNQIDVPVIFINKTQINSPTNQWYRSNWCRIQKEDDKIFVFTYHYITEQDSSNTTLEIVLQNELEMPEPVNIWVAVGSTVGAIILIGLISLILWKVLTDIYDEREYNQFQEKARAAGYDVTENPCYEPPITNFINPAHELN